MERSFRRLRDMVTRGSPPTFVATVIGVCLGLLVGGFSGEAIDPAAPAYGSSAFFVVLTVSWGAIGGLAFSRRLGFPPSHPTAADWIYQGGLRGTAAALLSMALWFLSWALLDLDGPKPRFGGDPLALLGVLGGYVLIGFFMGALFASAVGLLSSNGARGDGGGAPP